MAKLRPLGDKILVKRVEAEIEDQSRHRAARHR